MKSYSSDSTILGICAVKQMNRALFRYPIRRIIVRSRKVSKPLDLYLELSDRSKICQEPQQHCCWCDCQISKQYFDLNYQSRGFQTSRDIMIRRLIRYWNGAQVEISRQCFVHLSMPKPRQKGSHTSFMFMIWMISQKQIACHICFGYINLVFLAATKQLYKWYFPSVRLSVRLSVCPSVRLSVCPSHLFDYVPIIVSSWNFQELLPVTEVTSMQKVKVRGQRSRSQRSQPNFTVSGL